MDNVARAQIFEAQVQNVRALTIARTQVRRAINDALKTNNERMVLVQTKLLGLLFCAWTEANFLKLVHIPSGFTLLEIKQIKAALDLSTTKGWKKCVELGLGKKIDNEADFTNDARTHLNTIIDEYVSKPAQLRNKIAHGQWMKALNSKNTAINIDLTNDLDLLDVVKIETWFECHTRLAAIVENLIASSTRVFVNSYWTHTVNLEEYLRQAQQYSLDEKKRLLQRRRNRRSGEASVPKTEVSVAIGTCRA
jgi:hypothetical protein